MAILQELRLACRPHQELCGIRKMWLVVVSKFLLCLIFQQASALFNRLLLHKSQTC
jgi:hypothetical protein